MGFKHWLLQEVANEKMTSAQRKVLDKIDSAMLRNTGDFHRARGENERIFGGPLSPPSWADEAELSLTPAGRRALEELIARGLVERQHRRDMSGLPSGARVRRLGLAAGYYDPPDIPGAGG